MFRRSPEQRDQVEPVLSPGQERGRQRFARAVVALGLAAIGTAVLIGGCYAREAGDQIATYNANLMGIALIGASLLSLRPRGTN